MENGSSSKCARNLRAPTFVRRITRRVGKCCAAAREAVRERSHAARVHAAYLDAVDQELVSAYVPPLGEPNALNPQVYLDISINRVHIGRIRCELKADVAPRTAENFVQLCCRQGGARGCLGCGGGRSPAGYAGNRFHRIVPGFMCEAGDIKASHGAQSIYGRLFADEQHALLTLAHGNGPGVLSMANEGRPNSNGSRFFIVTGAEGAGWLDGKHVAFGQVLDAESMRVALAIDATGAHAHDATGASAHTGSGSAGGQSAAGGGSSGAPAADVRITACGLLDKAAAGRATAQAAKSETELGATSDAGGKTTAGALALPAPA